MDQTGGYTFVFVAFGLVQIAGGLLILSIALLFKLRDRVHVLQ